MWRYAPGTSKRANYSYSLSSIAQVVINSLVDTVGDVTSCFLYLSLMLCLLTSTHPLALIPPLRFYNRNINYPSGSDWCSLVRVLGPKGKYVYMSCSWVNCLVTAFYPQVPDFLRPFLILNGWIISTPKTSIIVYYSDMTIVDESDTFTFRLPVL